MIAWLARHRFTAAILAAGYSSVLIFGHGAASRISDRMTESLTRILFNRVITSGLLAALVLFLFWLATHYRRLRPDRHAILFPAASMLLAVAAFSCLMVTDIESIHFPIYAALVVPLLALTRSFGSAVLLTALCGVVDETYQYLCLYGDLQTVYFDFNDVVLNLIGAGLGATVIYLAAGNRNPLDAEGLGLQGKSNWLCLPTVIGIILILAVPAGLVSFYPDATGNSNAFLLSRAPAPAGYWTHFPWGKTCHFLHPLEGLILAQGLVLFYGMLDGRKVVKSDE